MILGAVMVPHPPIIIPEIGKGEEAVVQETIDAYHRAMKILASWQPDTIVLISPHAELYRDYFQISPGKEYSGDMARFNAKSVCMKVEYDEELVDLICSECEKEKFPAGNEYPDEDIMDHGTMVPLYFLNQYLKNYKLVRLGLSGLSLSQHKHLGEIIQNCSDLLGRRVAVVASGDLSHYVNYNSPYGYRPEGEKYEQEIIAVMSKGDFDQLLDFSNTYRRQAGECGHGSFTIMSGVLSGYSYQTEFLSHQTVFGIGYGICVYTCLDPYIQLAKETIETYIKGKGEISPFGPKVMFQNQAGVFVSIHKNHRLRGCIGTFMPCEENMAQEIVSNAISASTRDPRFEPIRVEELKDLEISVDVLGELESIDDISQLDVNKYGILVRDRIGRRGLLLPNLEGVNTVDQQIRIAMQKAGIDEEEDIYIERFEVQRHEM